MGDFEYRQKTRKEMDRIYLAQKNVTIILIDNQMKPTVLNIFQYWVS